MRIELKGLGACLLSRYGMQMTKDYFNSANVVNANDSTGPSSVTSKPIYRRIYLPYRKDEYASFSGSQSPVSRP